ncbi:MAG: DUF2975 domain-containing protein [Acidobacteria bacterium]|nr:DUF2975 domain-containing protein [Acidobacteriota bacterium]
MDDKKGVSKTLKVLLTIVYCFFILILFAGSINLIVLMINPHSPTNIFGFAQTYLLDDQTPNNHIVDEDRGLFDTQFLMTGFALTKTENRLILAAVIGLWLLYFFLYLRVIILLRRFLRTVTEGTPFIMENARRMRDMGLCLIGAEIVRLIFTIIAVVYLNSSLHVEGARIFISVEEIIQYLNLELYFAGLVLVVLSGIFKRGTEIQTDQDLTI